MTLPSKKLLPLSRPRHINQRTKFQQINASKNLAAKSLKKVIKSIKSTRGIK